MLDDVGSMLYQTCSNILQHVEWSSNTVAKPEKMFVHPTCWIVQHLSFGQGYSALLISINLVLKITMIFGFSNTTVESWLGREFAFAAKMNYKL